ncbi:MAG: oligosaccharide flippase family protein [Anaerolineae bacterium]|nr:oligosaccharide flippase family protein [Anaerolineae bacterium]
MREAARQRERTWELFLTTSALRFALFVAALPLLGGFLAAWQSLEAPLASETIWATVLLYLGLLPGSLAYGLAALFRGHEKHEYPAAIQTVTTLIKVTLGVLVLVGGLGIIGLAGASIMTNFCTLGILAALAYRVLPHPTPSGFAATPSPLLTFGQEKGGGAAEGGGGGVRKMLAESWPLMLSLLLQALFPGVNILLLQRLQGDAAVGWYDAARKWVDALNIIPSFFTIAIFPVMARLAVEDREALRTAYRLSVKLLLAIAFPTAVLVALLATPLVGLLSGSAFLPHGALALRLMVWSILFGWFNSLTGPYVLIALNRQRYVFLASGTPGGLYRCGKPAADGALQLCRIGLDPDRRGDAAGAPFRCGPHPTDGGHRLGADAGAAGSGGPGDDGIGDRGGPMSLCGGAGSAATGLPTAGDPAESLYPTRAGDVGLAPPGPAAAAPGSRGLLTAESV